MKASELLDDYLLNESFNSSKQYAAKKSLRDRKRISSPLISILKNQTSQFSDIAKLSNAEKFNSQSFLTEYDSLLKKIEIDRLSRKLKRQIISRSWSVNNSYQPKNIASIEEYEIGQEYHVKSIPLSLNSQYNQSSQNISKQNKAFAKLTANLNVDSYKEIDSCLNLENGEVVETGLSQLNLTENHRMVEDLQSSPSSKTLHGLLDRMNNICNMINEKKFKTPARFSG